MPDSDLVRRIRDGDEEGLRLLMEKYRPQLLVIAGRKGIQLADADDVVLETFLTAAQMARAGKLGKNVGPLLRTIAERKAIDATRRRTTADAREAEVVAGLAQGGRESGGHVSPRTRLVRRALERMNGRDRECLDWVGHGATIDDIAEYERSNKNAARQRKLRALRRLRAEIARLAKQGDPTAEELQSSS